MKSVRITVFNFVEGSPERKIPPFKEFVASLEQAKKTGNEISVSLSNTKVHYTADKELSSLFASSGFIVTQKKKTSK